MNWLLAFKMALSIPEQCKLFNFFESTMSILEQCKCFFESTMCKLEQYKLSLESAFEYETGN